MKRGTLILIMFLMTAGIAIAAVVSLLHDGLSARAKPTALEATIARSARRLAMPGGARAMANPVASSPESMREARLHFADHCAICHANDGGGETPMGRNLYPKPPDLREAHTQNLADGELFYIIENGVRLTGMPAFHSPGAELDSWKLVNFIRHLPRQTPQERIEMERYNPKGPDDREEDQREEEFLNGGEPQPAGGSMHHHH